MSRATLSTECSVSLFNVSQEAQLYQRREGATLRVYSLFVLVQSMPRLKTPTECAKTSQKCLRMYKKAKIRR
jgi:hypothetical protein